MSGLVCRKGRGVMEGDAKKETKAVQPPLWPLDDEVGVEGGGEEEGGGEWGVDGGGVRREADGGQGSAELDLLSSSHVGSVDLFSVGVLLILTY